MLDTLNSVWIIAAPDHFRGILAQWHKILQTFAHQHVNLTFPVKWFPANYHNKFFQFLLKIQYGNKLRILLFPFITSSIELLVFSIILFMDILH